MKFFDATKNKIMKKIIRTVLSLSAVAIKSLGKSAALLKKTIKK